MPVASLSSSTPGAARTRGLRFRKPLLCPTELPGQNTTDDTRRRILPSSPNGEPKNPAVAAGVRDPLAQAARPGAGGSDKGQHSGATYSSGAKARQRLVGILERERLDFGPEVHPAGQIKEFDPILPCQVGHRAHDALAP